MLIFFFRIVVRVITPAAEKLRTRNFVFRRRDRSKGSLIRRDNIAEKLSTRNYNRLGENFLL